MLFILIIKLIYFIYNLIIFHFIFIDVKKPYFFILKNISYIFLWIFPIWFAFVFLFLIKSLLHLLSLLLCYLTSWLSLNFNFPSISTLIFSKIYYFKCIYYMISLPQHFWFNIPCVEIVGKYKKYKKLLKLFRSWKEYRLAFRSRTLNLEPPKDFFLSCVLIPCKYQFLYWRKNFLPIFSIYLILP